MNPLRIGFLGFDGITALDLVGPMETFSTAIIKDDRGTSSHAYEVVTIGVTSKPFVSESGLVFKPSASLHNAPALDTLVIPGGRGLRMPTTQSKISAWIKSRASRIRRVASVCTGIYGLAPTGLLDGRNVTTHWRFSRDVATRFPRLKVDSNALFLNDGRFYTSAGVTAGIDLSLGLIEEDYGPQVALSVARELVVYLKRPGGQEQYSEPLRFQMQAVDPFAELAAWIISHLNQDLSVEALAKRAHLCPRHFSRRFKHIFGTTPAAFVEGLRLDEARNRLATRNSAIETVADSVGFKSADVFRRAFKSRFGISPNRYRSCFESNSTKLSRKLRKGAHQ
jgi:transcriptional regulator GlxA family with amidase domain